MAVPKKTSAVNSAVNSTVNSTVDGAGFALYSIDLAPPDPLYVFHQTVVGLAQALLEHSSFGQIDYPLIDECAPGQRIKNAYPAEKLQYLQVFLQRSFALQKHIRDTYGSVYETYSACYKDKTAASLYVCWIVYKEQIEVLLRLKLPYTKNILDSLLSHMVSASAMNGHFYYTFGHVAKIIERYAAEHGLDNEQEKLVEQVVGIFRTRLGRAIEKRVLQMLQRVFPQRVPVIEIKKAEVWSEDALVFLAGLSEGQRQHWVALLVLCQSADGGKPTPQWLSAAQEQLSQIDGALLVQQLLRWFSLLERPSPVVRTLDYGNGQSHTLDPYYIDAGNADIIKGLVWLVACLDNNELIKSLTGVAITAYKKVPEVGPRLVKIGNACVSVLGQVAGVEGVAQLAILKAKVKFGTAQKGIEQALLLTAAREGIPREDLEEMSVPSYAMESIGERNEVLGDVTALLRVTAISKTELLWLRADGKQQKTVPKQVKDNFSDELKAIAAAAKDIQKLLPAQRDRIERLFIQEKTWPFALWRERYYDHPLVGYIARRLIWNIDGQAVFASADTFVNVQGEALAVAAVADEAVVSLWHPIQARTDAIIAWRLFLEQHEICQPLKQAHREIYLLTDAELATDVYSNRYAAHIIKQHQFSALCSARGWKNSLKLMVDDAVSEACAYLPHWGLRAEFWTQPVGAVYGTDTNEVGTYYYLSTDQVRFYSIDSATTCAHLAGGTVYQNSDPVPLREIPKIVFSEIMRDIDLFVGVASVGNDPRWLDGGRERTQEDYWQTFSFGDLGASAETRKDVLSRLLPRLKIAAQCEITGRFLRVTGSRRIYKIHLGSGNILMEPNDQYLCIVPSRADERGVDSIFLPFAGDHMLSIILSKAFLLAADEKISDESIVSQITSRMP